MRNNNGKKRRKTVYVLLLAVAAAVLLGGCTLPWKKESRGVPEKIPETLPYEEEAPELVIEQPEKEEIPEPETEPEPEIEPEPVSVNLVFAGDIAFDPRYANMNSLISRGGVLSECIDQNLIDRMNGADICVINNEFPYSKRGTPTPGKKFTFRADPESVKYMQELGCDLAGLANNHAYDYGPDALLDTFDTLSGAGIPYMGAGHNLEEAAAPYYISVNGVTIGFACATQIERLGNPDTKEATADSPGVLRTLDPSRFLETIREAEENSDFTVVFVHWGTESVNTAEASQRELAAAYADAGADLIIGAHPHVLQGFEYVNSVPVMYSLGNFWFNSKTLDNCVVEAVVEKDGEETGLKELRFVPCLQKGCFTRMLTPGDGVYEKVLKKERSYSFDVTIDDEGVVTNGNTGDYPEAEPEETAPEPAAPPVQAIPADGLPGQTLPEGALPDQTVPAVPLPDQTLPEGVLPVQEGVPAENIVDSP
ncbi:MAG: CapA family protein [Lachnospiraceae bacterium]|nr:CapA family protein [Lachnospiraceae bacterium]